MPVAQKHKSNLVLSWSEVVYNGDQRKLCRNFQLQAGIFEHLIARAAASKCNWVRKSPKDFAVSIKVAGSRPGIRIFK